MKFVANAVVSNGYDLVILDPLSSQSPIEDENDAAMMTTVIVEFRRIVEAGAALLVAHHPSKAPMGQGRSSRGSGALPGFVDIILEFGRYQPEHVEDTRRVLMGLSRFKETPAEAVIELNESEYKLVGTAAGTAVADRLSIIMGMLSKIPVTREAIGQSWPEPSSVPRPHDRTLKRDMATLVEQKRIMQEGAGTKHSPYLYTKTIPETDSGHSGHE
jgi:hypothetical protein